MLDELVPRGEHRSPLREAAPGQVGIGPAGVQAQPVVAGAPRRCHLVRLVDQERPQPPVLESHGGRHSGGPGADHRDLWLGHMATINDHRRASSEPARSFEGVIAKVEPLTPARSLRGPFDYRLAGALEDVGVGSMLVVPVRAPAAARRGGGRGRRERAAAGAAGRADRGAGGGRAAVARARSGCGWRASTCPRRRAGWRWCCRPAPARARAARCARSARCGRRSRRRARRRCARAPAWARSSGRRSRRWRGAPLGAAALARAHGLHALDAAQPRAARPDPARERGGRAAAAARARGGRARAAACRSRPDQEAAFAAIEAARSGSAARARRRCSCTASPAAARPRSTCARWPPRSSAGSRRSCSSRRSRSRRRRPGRFVERFGDHVAVMHSRLSQRERYDEWWRMRRGEARVCVGPRSAVFAPFDDLGLIVVDEEHDGSYKQEGDPRYDARARRRAPRGRRGRRCSWPAAPRRGRRACARYERIRLPARVDGRELPPVELVGMAGARRAAPRAHARGARRGPPPRARRRSCC